MESSSTKVYLVHRKDLNSSNSYCKQRSDLTASSRKLPQMTGCLEIIEGEDSGQSKMCQDSPNYSRPSSNTGTRPWSRGSISYFPPRTDSSMSRHINTPTKQISLQAVRRKQESTEPFVDQVNWHSLACENNRKDRESETKTGYSKPTKQLVPADRSRLETVETSWQPTGQLLLKPRNVASEVTSQTETFCEDSILKTAQGSEINSGEKNRDEKNSDDNDDDDDDSDSNSSEEEEEKLRAPNELLMEFVDCLMRKDYQTASKLCKMVLLYEPENPEALKFQPLIEEKLVLDAEAEAEAAKESSENDDSDDESEDADDSSDDSGDDVDDDDDDGDGESCSDADRSDEDNDDDDK
ncbi:hypothetical protein BsWGS_25528 [Bradybaena similaris]